VGILIGLLYLVTAFTAGPLTRYLVLGGIWGGLGLLWLVTGILLRGVRER